MSDIPNAPTDMALQAIMNCLRLADQFNTNSWMSQSGILGPQHANILLRADSASADAGPAVPPKWIVISVEKPRHSENFLMLLCPTQDPNQLLTIAYEHWISVIQSSSMSHCGVNTNQCDLLLKLALALRAYTTEDYAHLDNSEYDIFATRLNTATHRLGRFESAEDELVEALVYLELHLPMEVFDAPDVFIPLINHDLLPIPSAHTTNIDSVPSVTGEGYDSDGSIPSLHTYHSGSDCM
ncbi:hypothetical protein C2E23DRAFT_889161 [Lenzites betulinus]|nr:hypothetical protein C2E23DRAFT_889161 [Lenzites betulinus]